jgi:hypothetical protein
VLLLVLGLGLELLALELGLVILLGVMGRS